MKQFLSLIFLQMVIFSGYAQSVSDTTDFFAMSLEELMEIPITVASTEALSPRQSPGIVNLITADEIARSGARDLIDVLRVIPGFEFGVDVESVIGLGLRGNWGHEGKILILLDGQEMNERSYATTPLGHHFPLDQIERIEIIRGPGSATYGGYAELGVINIITKKGKNLNGVSVAGTYGQMPDALGRVDGTVMVGRSVDDMSFDVKLSAIQGNRSDRLYTDFYGDSYDMADNSALSNLHLNGGFNYKGLDLRMIYDDYTIQQRDLFDAAMPVPIDLNFKSVFTQIKYDYQLNDKIKLTPLFRYKRQNPWTANSDAARELDNGDFEGLFYDRVIHHSLGELTMNVNFSPKVNLIAGTQYNVDRGTTVPGYEYSSTNGLELEFSNFSFFTQGLFKLDIANITIGARYNNHEQFGASFVPRLGLTKVIDKFHAKLLISQAFRAPSVDNIDSNPAIDPELTTVFEIEAGYQLTNNMFITANFFDISIEDPIVYFYDPDTDEEGYDNFEGTGTRGVEVEYKYKGKWGTLGANYSFYTAHGDNRVEFYAVPDNEDRLLGFAQSKTNIYGSISLSRNMSLSPTITILGERQGFAMADANDEPVLATFDPVLFANIFLQYRNLLTENLTVGVGAYNLTDNDYAFIQPYNSGHSPLPASSREVILKMAYRFGFN